MNRINLILSLIALGAAFALVFTPEHDAELSKEIGILNSISCEKVGKSKGRDLISIQVNSLAVSLNTVDLYPCEKHHQELESLVGKNVEVLYQNATLWSLKSSNKEHIKLKVLSQSTKTGWLVLLVICLTVLGVRHVRKT